MDPDELEAIVTRLENRLRTAWRGAMRDLKDETKLAELERRIATNQLDVLVDGVDEAIADFTNELAAGYVYAGQRAARDIEGIVDERFRFDLADPAPVEYMQTSAEQIAAGLVEEQQAVARRVVQLGLDRGLSTRAIAEEVQASVGLSPAAVEQVATYRDVLQRGDLARAQTYELSDGRYDAMLARMNELGQTLGADKIEAMVDRYRDNWISYRADAIAENEANATSNAGIEEAFGQAIDRELFSDEDYEREWVSRGDSHVRASHRHLDGEVVTGDDVFHGFDGDLRYPGDEEAPSSEVMGCRCRLARRVRGYGETVARGPDGPIFTDHRGVSSV